MEANQMMFITGEMIEISDQNFTKQLDLFGAMFGKKFFVGIRTTDGEKEICAGNMFTATDGNDYMFTGVIADLAHKQLAACMIPRINLSKGGEAVVLKPLTFIGIASTAFKKQTHERAGDGMHQLALQILQSQNTLLTNDFNRFISARINGNFKVVDSIVKSTPVLTPKTPSDEETARMSSLRPRLTTSDDGKKGGDITDGKTNDPGAIKPKKAGKGQKVLDASGSKPKDYHKAITPSPASIFSYNKQDLAKFLEHAEVKFSKGHSKSILQDIAVNQLLLSREELEIYLSLRGETLPTRATKSTVEKIAESVSNHHLDGVDIAPASAKKSSIRHKEPISRNFAKDVPIDKLPSSGKSTEDALFCAGAIDKQMTCFRKEFVALQHAHLGKLEQQNQENAQQTRATLEAVNLLANTILDLKKAQTAATSDPKQLEESSGNASETQSESKPSTKKRTNQQPRSKAVLKRPKPVEETCVMSDSVGSFDNQTQIVTTVPYPQHSFWNGGGVGLDVLRQENATHRWELQNSLTNTFRNELHNAVLSFTTAAPSVPVANSAMMGPPLLRPVLQPPTFSMGAQFPAAQSRMNYPPHIAYHGYNSHPNLFQNFYHDR